VVREWFDIGPDTSHDYTPLTEGFDYYFTISEDGYFKSYRDGVLEDEFILSSVDFEIVGSNSNVLVLKLDCGSYEMGLIKENTNLTNDTIACLEYPLNFYNEIEKRESKDNFFVRE
jgi:hypothetical protein